MYKVKTPTEHYYNKLREELLASNYFSSSFIAKARSLKQQDEEKYLKKIHEIEDYLFDRMKDGDMIAYALFRAAHEEKIARIQELNDFNRMKSYLQTHRDSDSHNNDPYFDPKVTYFAEILGSHDELWSAE